MIIAIDMDGTLLNSDGKISERNQRSILQCQENNHQVVIATGRAYKDADRQLRAVGLDCPIISLNGAAINLTDMTAIHDLPLDKDSLIPVLEWVRDQNDLYCEIYCNDNVYAGLHNREHLESLSHILDVHSELKEIVEKQFQQAVVTYIDDIRQIWLGDKDIYKVLIFSLNMDALHGAQNKFSELSGYAITSSHPNNIEINHEKATKGQALIKLASYLQTDMKETIVIGDSLNDLPMFNVAGIRVAMENAAPLVKEKSDHITLSNDEDGVSVILEELLSKSEKLPS
ncbi:Cof-type HAD-IIB family hydrolase [Fictibacillus barbaricus]|uniref:HAD family phosphatase n=1 Tax=Fictibacillus barbaricus TaxID=182136 RepID=A0ABS2ZEP0_9BACL|nr:Cof-type HAD-IIB family hydrolase [Fictibacillus barbaricus]MBN3545066.1 HAD family phosphatase [Fictibacillus barbaricus]GGB62011.1 phosphatase YwpJ [Fictibacillus barbaricus]